MTNLADDVLSLGTGSPLSPVSDCIADDHVDPVAAAEAAGTVRHKSYFLGDKPIQLRVAGTVFRIHSHFFLRESDEARALVDRASNAEILELEDATADDLERFCDVLYCGCADTPLLHTQAEWTSVIHLAHRRNFSKIRSLAIEKLAALAPPVDRIVLARAYGIDQWLSLAYQMLCERDACLSDEEGVKLGVHDVLKIARARMAIRWAEVILDAPTRITVVDDIFFHDTAVTTSAAGTSPPFAQGPELSHVPLVIPASALPAASKDVTLSPLPMKSYQDLTAAIAAVNSARQEAQLAGSMLKIMAAEASADLVNAEQTPESTVAGSTSRIKYLIAQNTIKICQGRMSSYEAQLKQAEVKVERSRAAVSLLLSQVRVPLDAAP